MSPRSDPWGSFPHDPRDPALATLRAADTDRDLVRSVLSSAYAEGRLSRNEFDERSDQVGLARMLGDLPPLMRDLVPARPAPQASPASDREIRSVAEDAYLAARRQAILTFIGPSLICWAIWGAISLSAGSATFPWPLIVMAATFVGALRTVMGKSEWIDQEVRRLEKRRTKQLKGRNRARIVGEIRDQIAPPRRDRGDDRT